MKLTNSKRHKWHLAAFACLMLLLGGCSDGGGGAAAPQVDPGPPPANTPVDPPAPTPAPPQPNYYAEADEVAVTITGVTIASPPVIEFQVVDGDGVALTGLTSGNVRAHVAKLVPAENGNAAYWQSYINRLKTPNVVPTNDPAVQATSERGGTLVDNGDGTYTYTMVTDITNVTSPLAVEYEPDLTHRVGFQFSGGIAINPTYDWVPANNATSGIETLEVVATETCNTCHDPLAMHGGGRIETKLCVMCHNPGTTEPNSLTSMDFKVLIHKLHMGRDLPSVQAGGEYVIYGYRDRKHDYSKIGFPQDVNNCAKCHTGSATADHPITAAVQTSHGDNWAEVPTMQACGSCHDDVDFSVHQGGQVDNSGCESCHSITGIVSAEFAHRNEALIASSTIDIDILSVTNTDPGDFPTVTFQVTNPLTGTAYDITTDPLWSDSRSRLRLALAWDTADFTNTGWIDPDTGAATLYPAYARTDALVNAVSNGDGTYTLTSLIALPDGTAAPGRAADGSGMAIFEGRARLNGQSVAFEARPVYFSINEADGEADARRQVVSTENCNACHGQLALHGGNRTNPEAQCQGCHNARWATAAGEPIDLKSMIHGIHGAGFREEALVIRGDPFDTDVVHFPGEIADCHTCHVNDSFTLPLGSNVLASTRDMGTVLSDPSDDLMITPTAAVCSSCHDTSLAQSHMEQNGADFSATEATIAAGVSTETCTICHGEGRQADVQSVHHDPSFD
jgi:OmcA/MtrC family decaheme c-type cytochrome